MSPATRREIAAWTRAVFLVALITAVAVVAVVVGLKNAGLI